MMILHCQQHNSMMLISMCIQSVLLIVSLYIAGATDSTVPCVCKCYCNRKNLDAIPPCAFAYNCSTLYLQYNDITNIEPGVFTGLTKLHTLYLQYNDITNIEPGVFTGLTKLQTLQISNNDLVTIENGTLTGLINLTTLFLGFNNITNIEPGVFTGLTNLSILYFGSNKLVRIETDTFTGLANLKNLHLEKNELVKIEIDAFTELTGLQYINIERNNLTIIETGTFKGLKYLHNIYLGHNNLIIIEMGAFEGLPQLRNLDLQHNDIHYISVETFYSLHSIYSISIYGNPLNCNCKLKPWIELTISRKKNLLPSMCVRNIKRSFPCKAESLFTPNLTCTECSSAKGDISCHNPRSISCETENSVCLSRLDYNGGQLEITKGCSNDTICHQSARENKNTCFGSRRKVNCTLCCLKENCNGGNIDMRTTQQRYTVIIELHSESVLQEQVPNLNETSYSGKAVIREVETKVDNITGFPASCDVILKTVSQSNSIVVINIMCTMLKEFSTSEALSVLNETFQLMTHSDETKIQQVIMRNACDDETYGPDCVYNCGHCLTSTSCDMRIGVCTLGCIAGYRGIDCTEACDSGTHGANCADKCGHCFDTAACERHTGACIKGCAPGFSGIACKNVSDDTGSSYNEQNWTLCLVISSTICSTVTGILILIAIKTLGKLRNFRSSKQARANTFRAGIPMTRVGPDNGYIDAVYEIENIQSIPGLNEEPDNETYASVQTVCEESSKYEDVQCISEERGGNGYI